MARPSPIPSRLREGRAKVPSQESLEAALVDGPVTHPSRKREGMGEGAATSDNPNDNPP